MPKLFATKTFNLSQWPSYFWGAALLRTSGALEFELGNLLEQCLLRILSYLVDTLVLVASVSLQRFLYSPFVF